MNPYNLPQSLEVAGKDYPIRTDFRAILDILIAQNDSDLSEDMRAFVLLKILFKELPPEQYLQQAYERACFFIDAQVPGNDKKAIRVMDWEQDAPIIIPAINRVAGTEVRAMPYMHWWTFLGYYMEIGESFFSEVVSIRVKKGTGKKLEKYEQEFYRENKSVIDLNAKVNARSEEEKEALRELFGLKRK